MPALEPLKPLKFLAAASAQYADHKHLFLFRVLQPAVFLSSLLLTRSSLSFVSLRTPKAVKILRGSFHQVLWPQTLVVTALQPAVYFHIRCYGSQTYRLLALKFLKPLQSLAATSTKHSGHKHLFLERCSLPFASIALYC
jgi:hypothetical protein